METAHRHQMGTSRAFLRLVLVTGLCCGIAAAQTSKTVRHHRVAEGDPDSAKLTDAENDIGNHNFANAEPILKQIVTEHPGSYVAWYDLGYLYHALGRRDASIAAYKKSVEINPDIFESNLNLGLALADAGQPEAEQYLRAATRLQPKSYPEQCRKRAWMALGTYLQSHDSEAAVNAFRHAAAAEPNDPEPHV